MKRFFYLVFIIVMLSTMIFSKSCGGNISCECGDIITSPYTMNHSLYCEGEGLLVRNSLNCNNFSIVGSGNSFGLQIDSIDKKEISFCTIKNFSQGIILGSQRNNDKAEYLIFRDLIISGNDEGVFLGKEHRNTLFTNSEFRENLVSIKTYESPRTLIINNTFFDSTFDYRYSSSLDLCEGGFGNTFLGEKGTTCSCFIPQNSMIFTTSEQLCNGLYYLPDGIEIKNRVNLQCGGAYFIGNGSNIGIIGRGVEYSIIDHCNIRNYSTGSLYTYDIIKNRYYGSHVQLSKNNQIHNSSFLDVDVGVEFDSKYGNSKAEIIRNSIIHAKDFIFKNLAIFNLDARNNSYGTNNIALINDQIYHPQYVTLEPFREVNKNYSFSLNNFIYDGEEISFDIHSQENLFDSLSISIYLEYRGEVIHSFDKEITFYHSSSQKIYLPISYDIDSISIIISEKQPFLSKTIDYLITSIDFENRYFLEFENLSFEEEYLLQNIFDNYFFLTKSKNASSNSINFLLGEINSTLPYAFDIVVLKNTTTIIANSFIGVFSGANYLLENLEILQEEKYHIYSRSENIDAFIFYNFFESEANMSNFANFSLDSKSISNKFIEEELFEVPIHFNNTTLSYSFIRKRISKLNFFSKKDPIIMSGGLWSNREAFNYFSNELIKYGYTVYLLEMNGGDMLECAECYNYNYEDLFSIVLPTLTSTILNQEQANNFIYVGHSNGGRVFLDSIENKYIDPALLSEVFLLGVPGAFEDLSLFGILLKLKGESSLEEFENKGLFHISQGDVAYSLSDYSFVSSFDIILDIVGSYMNFNSPIRISTELFSQYISWIKDLEDEQPGAISLDEVVMISGNPKYLLGNDIIVSIRDMIEIFSSIKSDNKRYYELETLHFDMTQNEEILQIILKELEVDK